MDFRRSDPPASRGDASRATGSDDTADSTVLIVAEGGSALAEMYPAGLRDDYRVRVARNGLEALAALEETIDVVLLEPRIHGITAAELCRRIRGRGYLCRIGVVGIDVPSDPIEEGFDVAIERPVSGDELGSRLRRLVDRHRYDAAVRERYRFDADGEGSESRIEAIRDELDRLRDRLDVTDYRALSLTLDCDPPSDPSKSSSQPLRRQLW